MQALPLTSVVSTEIGFMPASARGHEYVVPTEGMVYGRSAPPGEMDKSVRRRVSSERDRTPNFR